MLDQYLQLGIWFQLADVHHETLALSSFALAIGSLVLSIVLIIVSFIRSVRTLNHEIETDDEGIRFGL